MDYVIRCKNFAQRNCKHWVNHYMIQFVLKRCGVAGSLCILYCPTYDWLQLSEADQLINRFSKTAQSPVDDLKQKGFLLFLWWLQYRCNENDCKSCINTTKLLLNCMCDLVFRPIMYSPYRIVSCGYMQTHSSTIASKISSEFDIFSYFYTISE